MAPPRVVRIGVAGLGRAFMVMLPTLVRHPSVRLVAAADPRPDARSRFEQDFEGHAYASVEAMCADPAVDVVYVATPHGMHVDHVRIAAAHSKHVLVEKPMALTVADCRTMIDAARAAGVLLLVGHSHSFDLPYLRTRALIETGEFGPVRIVNALNFTDFLYRPRRPEELDTARGGGAVYNQAAHQVDVARVLAGTRAASVRAATGIWDPERPTEGAYTAFLAFEGGVNASLTYNGYGRFDTDELCNWIGEMGLPRDPEAYGAARLRLRGVQAGAGEAALRIRRSYGADHGAAEARAAALPQSYNHFGFVVASCERADLRPMPNGVMIYGETARRFEALPPPAAPRAEVIDALIGAVLDGRPPLHSGEWGLATVEICEAILTSAREGREVALQHQTGSAPA
jgi:phthalate 4,5-cis-dihydrodiol dehydrogenase